MKNIALFMSAIAVSAFISSCSKEDEPKSTTPTPVTYDNYSALAIGNYWIYERFEVDTFGNVTALGVFDSCYVDGDTLINGQTYFKMFRPAQNPIASYNYLRDSLHYIVNSTGEILFSSVDFTNELSSGYSIGIPGDTVCEIVRQMADNNFVVNLPAGQFTTLNAKEYFYMYPNWSFNGSIRYKHNRYSKDIGLVVETLPLYASDPNRIEKRLVRYNVN